MSLENFCTYIENSETKPFIKYKGNKSVDTDLKLLEAMREHVATINLINVCKAPVS